MKAISIHQPWSSLIALGEKHYETRNWKPQHRGPIVIHASRSFSKAEQALLQTEPIRSILATHGIESSNLEGLYAVDDSSQGKTGSQSQKRAPRGNWGV